MARILVVDDEPRMVAVLKADLARRGHVVSGVTSGAEALVEIRRTPFDIVLTDLRMDGVDGLHIVDGVTADSPGTAVIVLTAYGDIPSAVSALRKGAAAYLTKPCNFDEVALAIERALAEAALARENRLLKRAVAMLTGKPSLVGKSPAMRRLLEMIEKVAPTDATVLVRGESGSGKELVARAVHQRSPRAPGPFVAINCAAIPDTLLESELFGYRRGAFTGAERDREGLFESARGGTLLLDEIGEAGAAVQAKLLRVLEERKFNRLGDPRERDVDVRIIAATNRPLEQAISSGQFRQDLYYRLQVFPLDVPPLRERVDDIEPLVAHFLGLLGRPNEALPAAAMARLRAYSWPGNVRELRNLIERAHILAAGAQLRDEHVLLDVGPAAAGEGAGAAGVSDDLNLENNERRLIRAALAASSGNKTLAAQLLGITRRTLYSRLRLLGMEDETARRHGKGPGAGDA